MSVDSFQSHLAVLRRLEKGRCQMQGSRWISLVVTGLLSVGCTVSELKDGIPIGEWHGQGVFVYDVWGTEEEATGQPSSPASLSRTYPTHVIVKRSESLKRR